MSAPSGSTVVTRPRPGRTGPQPLWRQIAGDAVRERRRTLGLRLRDVADRAGISPQYLSEVERGRKEPSSEMLASICGALGLPLLDLLRAAGRRLNGGDGTSRPTVATALPAPAVPGPAEPAPPASMPRPAPVPGQPTALEAPVPEPTAAGTMVLRPTVLLRPAGPSPVTGRVQGLLLAA